jgi:hypothetical protein
MKSGKRYTVEVKSTLTEPHGTGHEWWGQLLYMFISDKYGNHLGKASVTMCMALDTAHKAPNMAIYTGYESKLVYMASCKTQCACGYQNKDPGTDARRKVVSRKGEADAASSGYVLLRKSGSSAGNRDTSLYMFFRSNP